MLRSGHQQIWEMCKLVPKPLYAILHKWTRHNYFSFKVIAMKLKTCIYIENIFKCSKYGVCSQKNRDIQSGEQGPGSSTRLPIWEDLRRRSSCFLIWNLTENYKCYFETKQTLLYKEKWFKGWFVHYLPLPCHYLHQLTAILLMLLIFQFLDNMMSEHRR